MKVYRLYISLNDVQPPIWRRIQVPADLTLFQLNFIFQLAMGWNHSHLHEFSLDGTYYGIPNEEYDWDYRDLKDERDYRLNQVIPEKGFEFGYLYDFGDSWEHSVQVEDILEPKEGATYPACLDGARACPPDDVGGTPGYDLFLEAIADPEHPEHETYLIWIGGSFDPETFDRERVDRLVRNFERSEMMRAYQRYEDNEQGPQLVTYPSVSEWMESLSAEQRAQLEALPLRRDTVSMLSYLRDHRVKGTQSSGNFPLKVIREIASRFVDPPELDDKIGDRVYKLRTEYDVWSIYFPHCLLVTGGLLTDGKGRWLQPTPKGLEFLAAEPAIQVWFLLESWWYHTSWLIAAHWVDADYLPREFMYYTLGQLLQMPAGQFVIFEEFADRLIERTAWMWTSSENPNTRRRQHSIIEAVVVKILKRFQVVEIENKDILIGNSTFKELHAFWVSELGAGLLNALAGGQH